MSEVMFAALVFPHTSQLCKLQLERSKDLRHHFLIGAPKLPFSNALLSTFKLKQLLEQLMTVYFTQQLEFTEATHVFSHKISLSQKKHLLQFLNYLKQLIKT